MTLAQASNAFDKATMSEAGKIGELNIQAIVVPNTPANTSRIEIWKKTDTSYELLAVAPKAGCTECSGPTGKPNPTKIWISDGTLHVEYQGGGAGFGFWAWRSSWGWDPALAKLRPVATQRIGADGDGNARHAMVNFISGARSERLKLDSSLKTASCTAEIPKTPSFSELSLSALFDGTLEPSCMRNSNQGDPVARSATPSTEALSNMLKASSPSEPKTIKPGMR
jgi:hypothetical protein